jgi:hypothetical protein
MTPTPDNRSEKALFRRKYKRKMVVLIFRSEKSLRRNLLLSMFSLFLDGRTCRPK